MPRPANQCIDDEELCPPERYPKCEECGHILPTAWDFERMEEFYCSATGRFWNKRQGHELTVSECRHVRKKKRKEVQ